MIAWNVLSGVSAYPASPFRSVGDTVVARLRLGGGRRELRATRTLRRCPLSQRPAFGKFVELHIVAADRVSTIAVRLHVVPRIAEEQVVKPRRILELQDRVGDRFPGPLFETRRTTMIVLCHIRLDLGEHLKVFAQQEDTALVLDTYVIPILALARRPHEEELLGDPRDLEGFELVGTNEAVPARFGSSEQSVEFTTQTLQLPRIDELRHDIISLQHPAADWDRHLAIGPGDT